MDMQNDLADNTELMGVRVRSNESDDWLLAYHISILHAEKVQTAAGSYEKCA